MGRHFPETDFVSELNLKNNGEDKKCPDGIRGEAVIGEAKAVSIVIFIKVTQSVELLPIISSKMITLTG